MSVRVDWHGDERQDEIDRKATQLVTAMAITVKNHAKRLLSIPGTGRVKGRPSGPVTHAPAGAPPYKQTGRLRASVAHEVDPIAKRARVGTNVFYGRILELTNHPWLRRSLLESRGKIDEIAARIKRGL